MAKAPTGDSDEKHSTVICLTQSAGRYVDKHQIRDELITLDLDTDCIPSDIVSIEVGERPHDFIVLRRRWIISSKGRQLEITLDHPARALRA
jgi:hypothetical protein